MAKKPIASDAFEAAKDIVDTKELGDKQNETIISLTNTYTRTPYRSASIQGNHVLFSTEDDPQVFGTTRGVDVKRDLEEAGIVFESNSGNNATSFNVNLNDSDNYEKFVGFLLRKKTERDSREILGAAKELIDQRTKALTEDTANMAGLFEIKFPRSVIQITDDLNKAADVLVNTKSR